MFYMKKLEDVLHKNIYGFSSKFVDLLSDHVWSSDLGLER